MTIACKRSVLMLCFVFGLCLPAWTVNYPYEGSVSSNVKRDRILAIAEDYATLYYYQSAANIDYSGYTGATCPDATVGWKTGMKYCWGGEDSTREYLLRMTEGDGAGNKDTSSSSSYDQYCAGADCSGFVSNAWTSSRVATSGFPNISDDILWEQLRQGDALNDAGSHIRLFDYFISQVGTAMLYESTAGGGAWKCIHRSLARDDTYQPIRYRAATYRVVVYPQPDITYIKRTGVERVEVRWDGEANTGFNLYLSLDGTTWTRIRDSVALTYLDRVCEVSGLLPDHTYYFKMTSQNTAGESVDSDVVAYRLDGALTHRLLLVDGSDRYNDQNSGASHTLLTRFGDALAQCGIGFDFCSNEAVVDEQIDLRSYSAVVWMLGEESTFDETFSWAEQMH
ncbi:MAG TPA: fibronectin type III domain-containing protein, partial [bacterium]|nr:fibronectin type III domain-containing protein [bacterium]